MADADTNSQSHLPPTLQKLSSYARRIQAHAAPLSPMAKIDINAMNAGVCHSGLG